MNKTFIDNIEKLTSDQKNAVFSEGKIIVSAAAGSGKTFTMIQKIISNILSGISLRKMLVLVYNNAAADEIRQKLHLQLFELACTSTLKDRDIFRKELDELPFANISTIHSFCKSLIKEHFEKISLSPTFDVLDGNAHNNYMIKALEKVFEYYTLKSDDVFFDISAMFSQARREDNLKKTIIKLFEIYDIQPDKQKFFNEIEQCFSTFEKSKFWDILMEYHKGYMNNLVNECELILPVLLNFGEEQYSSNVVKAKRFAINIFNSKTFDEIIGLVNLGWDKEKAICTQKDEILKENVERAKAVFSVLDKLIEEIKSSFCNMHELKIAHEQNYKYISKMVEIVIRFSTVLNEIKEKDNVLSFSDLEHKAVELIKSGEDSFSGIYEDVFVDEYQDVNPTQEFIISHLIGKKSFMVGDTKQSIYGYRMADPTISLRRQQAYQNGEGHSISFNKNFRSDESILNFVNKIFDVVMTKKSGDIDYKTEARFETISEEVSDNVQIHLFTKSKSTKELNQGLYDITTHLESEETEKTQQREAKFVANQIKSLVGSAIINGTNGEPRLAGFGDVVLLFRSRKEAAKTIIKTLKQEGIPLDDRSFSKMEDNPEEEIMMFLRVLDNPRQDDYLAGYLLSYFGGYNQQDLADISKFSGQLFYDKFIECSKQDTILAQKIVNTLKTLHTYRIKASFKSVGELMQSIIADFCYDAVLMRKGSSNVFALKRFVGNSCKFLSIAKFLAEYALADDKQTAGGTSEDEVKVSTYHSFKGLEASIVFLCDVSQLYANKSYSGDISMDNSGRIGLQFFNFDTREKKTTLSKLAVAIDIKLREAKEEMRLFYVALTRAKQYMFITSSVSDKDYKSFGKFPILNRPKSNLQLISKAIYESSFNVCCVAHGEGDTHIPEQSVSKDVLLGDKDEKVIQKIKMSQEYIYPYAESTKLALKYSVSELDSIDDNTIRVYSDAQNLGTIYHTIMENIDFECQSISSINDALRKMVDNGLLSNEDISNIDTESILACLNSEFIALARKGKVYREKVFMMYRRTCDIIEGSSTTDKILVQGVADLVVLSKDNKYNFIVDYKNANINNFNIKKYKKQLYLYKMAVEDMFSVKIHKVILYSFKMNKKFIL